MKKLLKIITGVTLSLAMAIGVGIGVASNHKKAEPVLAAGKSDWLSNEVTASLNANDYYVFATSNTTESGGNYFDGTVDSNPHWHVSAFGDNSPSSNSAAGVIRLESVSENIWKIKLVSTNKYVIATKAGTKGSSVSAASDSSGWYFYHTNNVGWNAVYQTAYSSKYACFRDYNNGDFRSYQAQNSTTAATNGNAFKIFKYQAARTLSSISVSTPPTKTTYYAGECFNPSGLVIQRSYTTGDPDTHSYFGHETDFSFSPSTSTALTQENTSVSITYGGKTTSQAITVNATRTLSNISISAYTTEFDQYDPFDFGGTVTANYTNSTNSNVTASATFTGYNMSTAGNQTVTVSYEENDVTKTASYSITVNPVTNITFDATSDTGTSPLTKKCVTFSCSNGVLNNGAEYRLYKNSTTTFASSGAHIGRIEFTGTSDNPASGFGSQAGWTTNGYNGMWIGDAASVSFVASGAQVRATSIVITFVSTEPSVEISPSSINLKTNQLEGVSATATTHNIDSPTYLWTSNNQNVVLENATSAVATIKPANNLNANCSSRVTVTVGGVEPSVSAYVDVSITVPEPGETIGTAFSVSEAIAHINGVISGGEESGNDGQYYYARGIVSEIITPYNSQFGNITYNISADGETSGVQLQAYRGKGLNGNNFESENDIEVGATVVIYGNLKKHNDTYEFDSDNQLASYTAAPRYTVTFDSLGGSSVDPAQNVKKGTCISPLPVATKANDVVNQKRYELAGWYTVADPLNPVFEEGNRFTTSTPVNSNLTVYAKYNEINYYVVTFNTNGGSPIEAQNVDSGDTVAMPNNPTKASDASNTYTFEGWYTNAGLSDPFNGSEPITGNLTVYAKYTAEAISNPGSYLSSATSITTLHASETSADSGTISKTLAEIATANNWTTAAGSGTQPCYTSFNLNSNVQVSTTGSANCGSFWGSDWRLYQAQGGNVIISVSNGYKLTSVTFTYTVSNSGILKHGDDTLSSGTPFALTESTETFDVLRTGSGTNGQIRITNISVSYERALSVSNVAIRFGASIAKTEWDAINEHVGWQISDYGVMLMKASDKTSGGYTSVEDAYNKHASDSVLKIINKCAGGADYEDPYQDGDNYLFTVKVSFPNIPTNRNYINDVIYAVPFVVVGEQYYFLTEMHTSIHDLAESYLGAGHEYLSNAALGFLMGN